MLQAPFVTRSSLSQRMFHPKNSSARAAGWQFFAIEIYAGTARLTASLRALGLIDSFGVDSVLPQRLNGPIVKLDLLNPSHLEHVKSLICNPACVYVHFAPPCGTASRARLIQNQQQTLPPPLRARSLFTECAQLSGRIHLPGCRSCHMQIYLLTSYLVPLQDWRVAAVCHRRHPRAFKG